MPTDYNQGGTFYSQSMIVGINNSQAIVFDASGRLKLVANPFSATPIEALIVQADGTVNVASVTGTFPDGTAAAPSITFTSENTDGFFSAATGKVDVTTAGVSRADFSSSGLTLSSTGQYRFSATTDPAATADVFLGRNAAASLRLGAADAALPVAQTLGPQSVVTGTTDVAGADFSIAGSAGTGTGAGGSLLFKLAAAGSTGTTPNTLASKASLTSTGQLNLLLDTSVLRLGASSDVILGRQAAATLRHGAADAASPVAQTITVQSVVAGTTDTAGADLSLAGSLGTGTGVGGALLGKVAYPATTGSTQNSLSTVLTIGATNKASSGVTSLVSLAPIINGSGTNGYNALLVNATETAVGSGVKQLLSLAVGGTERFTVSSGRASTGTQVRTLQATVPTCSSNCGTTVPAVVGSDTAMRVTMAADGTPTAPVITFNGTWASAPVCTAVNQTTAASYVTKVLTTTTTATITCAANAANNDVFSVHCFGVV